MAVVRDIEPWDELLAAGREDERLVMQAAQNRRPARIVALPEELHPEVADALRGARRRAAVVAPGRGAARRLGRPDDRHHRHGERQVAVLPAADARHAVPRRARPRALPLPDEGARPGPGARAARARRRARAGRRSTTATRRASSARRSGGARTSILTNPDMLHLGILPNHRAWADVFANLAVVVVDEAHVYRGVFGSHVANVLRRLRRIAAAYGTEPRFLLASATIANPGELAERLTGLDDVTVVDRDGSPGPTEARSRCGTRRSSTSSSPRGARRWPRRPTCSPSWSARARARSCS